MEAAGWAGWWRLGETAGTTAVDAAGANDGTYVGSPTLGRPSTIYGDPDKSIAISGAKYVTVPDAAALDLGDTFTLFARVQLTALGTEMGIIAKGSNGYYLRIEEDGRVALLKQNSISVAYSLATLSADGLDHTIAVTKNGASVKIYVDGEEGTNPSHPTEVIANTASPLLIGTGTTTTEHGNFARLDEVAVADGVLSAEVLLALHKAAAGPPPPLFFAGLVQADFDEQAEPGAITEVPDPAGSGETVFEFTVSNEDTLGDPETVRAQLLSPNLITDGMEFWARNAFYLPADFPEAEIDFIQLLEWPYGPPFSGSPPFGIKFANVDEGPPMMLWQRNSTYAFDIPWSVPMRKGRWIEVLTHMRFAKDGWIELWIDGLPVTFFPAGSAHNPNGEEPTTRLEMEVRDKSNDGTANEAIIQSYRKLDNFDSVTSYSKGLLLGTTRSAVEEAGWPVAGGAASTITTTPRPSSLATPKMRVPLRLENGRLGVVEQDSPDNVAACVYALLSYERGSRIEDVNFGVEDPTFDQLPLDVSEWLQQIAVYEPRAQVQTAQEVGDLIGAVLVEVGLT